MKSKIELYFTFIRSMYSDNSFYRIRLTNLNKLKKNFVKTNNLLICKLDLTSLELRIRINPQVDTFYVQQKVTFIAQQKIPIQCVRWITPAENTATGVYDQLTSFNLSDFDF